MIPPDEIARLVERLLDHANTMDMVPAPGWAIVNRFAANALESLALSPTAQVEGERAAILAHLRWFQDQGGDHQPGWLGALIGQIESGEHLDVHHPARPQPQATETSLQDMQGSTGLAYYYRTTCACTAAERYVEDCPKHGNQAETPHQRDAVDRMREALEAILAAPMIDHSNPERSAYGIARAALSTLAEGEGS